MLSKKYRLPIQYLILKKNKYLKKTPILTVKVFESDLSFPRFGIIISKKISKISPQRNKLKRIIFSFIQPSIDKIKPADYLIIVNKKDPDKEEIKNALQKIFI